MTVLQILCGSQLLSMAGGSLYAMTVLTSLFLEVLLWSLYFDGGI